MMKLIVFLIFVVSCTPSKNEQLQKYISAKGSYLKGDLKGSEKIFEELYEDDPEFEDVDLHLIKIEFYRGNFEKCLEHIDNALESGRWQQQALLFKIRILLINSNSTDEILVLTEKMLKYDSSNLDALLLAGKVYAKYNRTSEAIITYNRIIAESERIQSAHIALSKIYASLGLFDNALLHEKAATQLKWKNNIEHKEINETIIKKIKNKRK
ncbi:hypothetical protein P3G55_16285 [Leptospira sp. 96542]|nr:hypothetical protein [Leptospira sp. 96542]